MDKEFLLFVAAVINPKISKGYIAKHHIKMVVWQLGIFKALYGDGGFLVKLLCNPASKIIKLHAIEL